MGMEFCENCFLEIGENTYICPSCGYKKGEDNSIDALEPGTILNGRYIIGRRLGRGAFGITYKALEYTTRSILAIKEYYPDDLCTRKNQKELTVKKTSEMEEYRRGMEHFLKEAKDLSRFKGVDGIVEVFEYFQENATAYFVMEYVDGMDLKQYLKLHNNKLTWKETKKLLLPIIDALAQVHKQNMIHRDFSPDNIYIANSGAVKLLDFGAAKMISRDESRNFSVVLKYGYAPVEQYYSNGNQGPHTDVYALGATIYRCLSGLVPPESLKRQQKDILQPLRSFSSDLPEKVEKVIMKAMEVNYRDRFKDVEEFREALIQAERVETKRRRSEEPLKREREIQNPIMWLSDNLFFVVMALFVLVFIYTNF